MHHISNAGFGAEGDDEAYWSKHISCPIGLKQMSSPIESENHGSKQKSGHHKHDLRSHIALQNPPSIPLGA